jgi:alkylation response protein AidB-like acyl-CoA dehydrogenase
MTMFDQGLEKDLITMIRKDAPEAERAGKLSAGQLGLIRDRKWLWLFVPPAYGGLALPLPEAVRLEENIAYADGSVGWVVTLCAGAAMFIGYFDETLRKEIFDGQELCFAGSGQPNGVAVPVEGGFRITGKWSYASGAPYATHFTANCRMGDTDEIRSFVFKRKEVQLYADWDYLGLNATAGYSFSVEELIVPSNRLFRIDARELRLPNPVYSYPFLQLAETTLAANISGMCLYFLELAATLIGTKAVIHREQRPGGSRALRLLAEAGEDLDILRKTFYRELDESWVAHTQDRASTTQLEQVSQASRQLAMRSRHWVNRLYPYCGMQAARTDTVINIVWRNINTASQHSALLE